MLGHDNVIKREISNHKKAYLVLFIELIIFVGLFMAAWPNRLIQRFLILLMICFYVAWGIMTHVKTDQISRQVVLEYVGVGFLAGLLLFLVTL